MRPTTSHAESWRFYERHTDTPARIQGPPILVGANTREVLADLGYDEAAIDALFEQGAVGDEKVHPILAGDGAKTATSPWAPDQ